MSDYYGKPYKIDFYNDEEDFMAAERYNFISTDDGAIVNWDNKKVSELQGHLGELNDFIEEYDEEIEAEMGAFLEMYEEEYHSPAEPNNQEFWEEHYSI